MSGTQDLQVPGLVFPSGVGPPLTAAAISINSSGANTIISGVTGEVIRVYAMVLVAAGSVTVQVEDNTNALTGAMNLATGVPLFFNFTSMPWFCCQLGDHLVLNLGTGVQVSGANIDRGFGFIRAE